MNESGGREWMEPPWARDTPPKATGIAARLYNSTQSSPPGTALASHSLMERLTDDPSPAAVLAAPGVGWVNVQPLATRPMVRLGNCSPKPTASTRFVPASYRKIESPSRDSANCECSPGAAEFVSHHTTSKPPAAMDVPAGKTYFRALLSSLRLQPVKF